MIIPEELELEAEFKGDAAIALAEESLRLYEAGMPIQADEKLEESKSLRQEAEALDKRADLLREAFTGRQACMQPRIFIRPGCSMQVQHQQAANLGAARLSMTIY